MTEFALALGAVFLGATALRITYRKAYAAGRSAARSHARASAALGSRVLNALGIIVWAVDDASTDCAAPVVRLSEGGGLAALGLTSGELVGATVSTIPERGNLAADGPDELDIIRAVFADGQRRQRTNAHSGPDGEVYFRSEYAALFDASGAVSYVCGVAVDVTEEEARARRTHAEAIRSSLAHLARPHTKSLSHDGHA